MHDSPHKSFWQYPVEQWFKNLNSSPLGVSDEFANIRNPDKLNHRKKSRFYQDLTLFVEQFKSPLDLLLIGAVILSAILGDRTDLFIVFFILITSGTLSFLQDRNATRIVEKLQSMISLKCNVIRSGVEKEIPSSAVVAGDVLKFSAGDMIPADCLIISSNELHANESSLTGESFPVRKFAGIVPIDKELSKRTNCLWEGTSIVSGTALALVVNTGVDTVFGGISKDVSKSTETTFEKGIKDFGYFLMRITLILATVILLVNLFFHQDPVQSILFALALSIGMAPELLPAISTLAMSAGAARLLKKNVIVKKLPSIQNLGEVNLLCTDKTGTLTTGEISVDTIVNYLGVEDPFTKELAIINARLESGYSNPIDRALRTVGAGLVSAQPRNASLTKSENEIVSGRTDTRPAPTNTIKLSEIPYDFVRKRISVLVANSPLEGWPIVGRLAGVDLTLASRSTPPESYLVGTPQVGNLRSNCIITKGSYKQILEICTTVRLSDGHLEPLSSHINAINKLFEKYGEEGKRVVAVCYKQIKKNVLAIEDEADMIFSGLVVISDPIKPGIVDTLDELSKLSVGLKIITGDNKSIAMSIGKSIGILEPIVMTGLQISQTSVEGLVAKVRHVDIFAEVEPQQKEDIIRALRKTYTVAYMGDGINDVSAMRAADVGISVENATDVVREAADFVFTKKDLSVLAEGIREGRKTYANTLKYIFINTGSTFGNMISVAIGSFVLPFLPMLPVQILLTNFITDFPYLMISSDNVDADQLSRPGKWNLKLVRNYMLVFGIHSSIFDLTTFLLIFFIMKVGESQFQTGWFIESVLSELFILFIIRTRKSFWVSQPSKYLLILSTFGLILTIIIPFSPVSSLLGFTNISLPILLIMIFEVACYIITADLLRGWFFRRWSNPNTH